MYKAYMESVGYKAVKEVYHNEPPIALYADDTIFVKTWSVYLVEYL